MMEIEFKPFERSDLARLICWATSEKEVLLERLHNERERI
jgi:hypothetical protein